ncbi:MAG: rhamnulokinase [Bacteroidales bacterium 45-6]|nr:MAG: rhamnulokinase [Bacteroidales bacterium 45-6]
MAYLAIDLGAGSGRAIVGFIENGKLRLEEIHRFVNPPVEMGGTLYWNFLSLFADIKEGIRLSIKKGYQLQGIGVDTWGVDYGLVDNSGKLLANPVCYRDKRTTGLSQKMTEIISPEKLFSITGIQQMEINTLFQAYSQILGQDKSLQIADRLLFMPDLINFFLTGKAFNEYTIASTSQLLHAHEKAWSEEIIVGLGLPSRLMGKIVFPGEPIGKLTKEIEHETGALGVKVFSVGSHDTASAIGAIPEEGDDWAFLSSGTWSLLGKLSDNPILDNKALEHDFTNEGGVNGKILFMRNITGLWLLQRLVAEWENEEGEKTDYDALLSKTASSQPFGGVVDPDNASFNHPESMTEAIRQFCRQTQQPIPSDKGELARCVIESLALKYRTVLDKIAQCTGKPVNRLHMVGGGSRNRMLAQYTANALNMQVTTGLTEGTAVGNIMQQAIGYGEVKDWREGHSIIRNSFAFETFSPENSERWASFFAQKETLFKKNR